MIARLVQHMVRFAARLRRSEQGSIALKFAFAGPAVILLGVGGIDLMAVHTAKARLQSIADAAALAGAPALALASDGSAARERADAFVRGQMGEWAEAPTYEASYEILDRGGQRAIRVLLRGHRTSFFANMLPPGGWNFIGDATASTAGLTPLCVLISGSNGAKLLNIKDSSQMKAPACLVHSNRDILVEGGNITAASVQAVTTAGGSISPSASTGAAPIEDPFADLDLERDPALGALCSPMELANRVKVSSGVHYVQAGRHCGGIEAYGAARVVLAPGEHFFLQGALVVKEDARLEGQDVVLFFDTMSKFDFTDRALVSLDGRKTGPYAGIVMGAMRDNRQDFVISADHVESLLGVIYVPSARLIVDGDADVARDSAWTVIVAKEMQMKGAPSLFINANYDATDVPVPAGVGPRGGARLIE
ncbi:MAG: TadE/TadG family type IV pilus assembly protein [Alphaproteobacteria bacterium]